MKITIKPEYWGKDINRTFLTSVMERIGHIAVHPRRCPIAQAMQAAGLKEPNVLFDYVEWVEEGTRHSLPIKADAETLEHYRLIALSGQDVIIELTQP